MTGVSRTAARAKRRRGGAWAAAVLGALLAASALLLWSARDGSRFAGLAGLGLLLAALACALLKLTRRVLARRAGDFSLTADSAASCVQHLSQPDGTMLTQITLSGWATNLTDRELRLQAIRIDRPLIRRVRSQSLLTRSVCGIAYGDFAAPPHGRVAVTAHLLVEGVLGRAETPLQLVASVADAQGRWRPWAFRDLPHRCAATGAGDRV